MVNGPTYPGTGNILGAGTAVEGEVKISGSEYGGFPPPVTGVTFFAPAGVKLHPQGFTTCSDAILESHEVAHCPKKSFASSIGSVSGVVSFGATRVHEALTLQGFFAPGGELAFYAEGRSPTVIEVMGKASVTTGGRRIRSKVQRERAAGGNRSRSALRSRGSGQNHGRSSLHARRQTDLLHHPAEEVPQGRLPGPRSN